MCKLGGATPFAPSMCAQGCNKNICLLYNYFAVIEFDFHKSIWWARQESSLLFCKADQDGDPLCMPQGFLERLPHLDLPLQSKERTLDADKVYYKYRGPVSRKEMSYAGVKKQGCSSWRWTCRHRLGDHNQGGSIPLHQEVGTHLWRYLKNSENLSGENLRATL